MLTSIQNEVYVIKKNDKGWVFLEYEYRDKVTIYKKTDGKVKGWRRSMFNKFAEDLKVHGETRSFVLSAKLKIYIMVLPKMKNSTEAIRLADLINDLGVEELAFWNWKLHVSRKNAVKAFRSLYGV